MVVLCPVGDVKILSLISTFLLKTLTLIELKRIFLLLKKQELLNNGPLITMKDNTTCECYMVVFTCNRVQIVKY